MRNRILNRAKVRPLEYEDIRWLWAAYKKGGLPKSYFAKDLNIDQFKETMAFILENYPVNMIIETKDPIAFAAGTLEDQPHYERPHVFPHVTWFPWASARDKVSGMASFIDFLSKDFLVLAAVNFEERNLFEFLCDVGFGKRIGTPRNWFKKGDSVKLFQTWSE